MDEKLKDDMLVCRCEEVTVADIKKPSAMAQEM